MFFHNLHNNGNSYCRSDILFTLIRSQPWLWTSMAFRCRMSAYCLSTACVTINGLFTFCLRKVEMRGLNQLHIKKQVQWQPAWKHLQRSPAVKPARSCLCPSGAEPPPEAAGWWLSELVRSSVSDECVCLSVCLLGFLCLLSVSMFPFFYRFVLLVCNWAVAVH